MQGASRTGGDPGDLWEMSTAVGAEPERLAVGEFDGEPKGEALSMCDQPESKGRSGRYTQARTAGWDRGKCVVQSETSTLAADRGS